MALDFQAHRGLRRPLLRTASLCAIAATFSLVGVRHTQDAVANGDTRSISIVHMHTKEAITVTFRRHGQYDQQALQQLNWILRDWRLDQPTRMDPRLFDIAWEVHREVGSSQPFHVVSAYRSPGTNSMLRRRSRGVAKHSQHMEGKAMDFYLPDVSPSTIRSVGMKLQRGGVGYYPSAYTPFIHLDVGSVRSWPRMTRDQLARLFPDGRTVHIPADGQPLSGYEVAKAEILSRGGSVGGYASGSFDEGAAMQGRGRSLWASIFGWNEEDESRPVSARGRASARGQPQALAYAPSVGGESTNMYTSAPVETAAPPVEGVRQPLRRGRGQQPAAAEPATQVAAAPADAAAQAARVEARPEPAAPPAPRLVNAPLPTARPTNLGAVQLAAVQPGSPAERLNWQQGAQPVGSDAVETPVRLVNAPMPPARPEALMAALPAAQATIPQASQSMASPDPAPRLVAVNHPAPPERPRAALASVPSQPAREERLPVQAAPTPTQPASAPAPAERRALDNLFAAAATGSVPLNPRVTVSRSRNAQPQDGQVSAEAAPAAALGFQREGQEPQTNRFSGPAVRPLPTTFTSR